MKYKGKQINIKNGKAREVLPRPYFVKLKDWDGKEETIKVEPSNPFYSSIPQDKRIYEL